MRFYCPFKRQNNTGCASCWKLTLDSQEREINGLLEAMRFFKIKNGIIVSANSTDTIRTELGFISVIPAYEYLMT